MNPIWSYLQNPFENRTKKSIKLMNSIATDHHDKLYTHKNTHQALKNLYHSFLPFYQKFKKNYTKMDRYAKEYKKNTEITEALFTELRIKKSVRWEAFILSLYDMDSEVYTSIFLNGRKVFYENIYEERIKALGFFIERLSKYPDLLHVKTDVEHFFDTLIKARQIQIETEKNIIKLSADLENMRKTLAERLHYNFAILLSVYYETPARVEDFFEMRYLSVHSKKTMEKQEEDTIKSSMEIEDSIPQKTSLNKNKPVEQKEKEAKNYFQKLNYSDRVINKKNKNIYTDNIPINPLAHFPIILQT